MFEQLTNRRSRWRVFWPEVDDLEGAEEAIRLCSWFAFVYAGIGAVVGLFALVFGAARLDGLIGALILAVTGVGVRRRWRSAAVAGLALLGLGLVGALAQGSAPGVLDALTFVAFMSGVRGTFAIARLSRHGSSGKDTPSAIPGGNYPSGGKAERKTEVTLSQKEIV